MTDLYGVIGDPVSHSLSPLIHRGWMRDLGIDADYRAFHVPAGTLAEGLETLHQQGVLGLNVTLPHKIDIAELCASMSSLAEMLGAVNTLSRATDGAWIGDNTDYQGFLDDFADAHGGILETGAVLVIGAGGAAQAVARGLHDQGYRVSIANRTRPRAEALVASLGLPPDRASGLDALEKQAAAADAVVNTLSAGHAGGALALGPGRGRLLYDISYGKAAAATLEDAACAGWKTADGLGMLVAQAALSFAIWHGVTPDRAAAQARCREALGMVS